MCAVLLPLAVNQMCAVLLPLGVNQMCAALRTKAAEFSFTIFGYCIIFVLHTGYAKI
jgi:hypothetical protein